MSLIDQIEDVVSAEVQRLRNASSLTPHEVTIGDLLHKSVETALQVHQQKQVDASGKPAEQAKPDVKSDEKPIAAVNKEEKRTDATTT